MNQDRIASPFGLSASEPGRTSRRGLLARLVALPAALGLATLLEGDAIAAKKGNGGGGGGYSPDNEERAFLNLINDYRRKNGAGNLSLQNQLGAAAEHHSQDMAKKNYFSHKLSNGDSAEKNIERHGYRNWRYIGENIAAGDETAAKVFERWRKSSGHDKNMRNKNFTEIGIGRAYNKSSKYGWYWTTTFGDR